MARRRTGERLGRDRGPRTKRSNAQIDGWPEPCRPFWRALTAVRKKGRSGVRAQMRRPTLQKRAEGEALQSEKKREKPTDAPHDLPQSSEWLNAY